MWVVSGVPQAAPRTGVKRILKEAKLQRPLFLLLLPPPPPIFFLFLFPVILYHFILDFASKTLTSRIKWRSSYISSRIIATHPPTTLVAQIHPASSWIPPLTRNSPLLKILFPLASLMQFSTGLPTLFWILPLHFRLWLYNLLFQDILQKCSKTPHLYHHFFSFSFCQKKKIKRRKVGYNLWIV